MADVIEVKDRNGKRHAMSDVVPKPQFTLCGHPAGLTEPVPDNERDFTAAFCNVCIRMIVEKARALKAEFSVENNPDIV